MHSFQIFSDGACDLTLEAQNAYQISTVPFYVSFDGKTYLKELKELTLDHFYHHLYRGKRISENFSAFCPRLCGGFYTCT